MTGSEWQAAAASRRGSAHVPDTPNQDAVGCRSVVDPAGTSYWVCAVADGHGGPRYVRSDIGASYAVDLAVEQVAAAITAGSATPERTLRRELPAVVARWRQAVLAHASATPFDDAEAQRARDDDLASDPVLAYGATLLVAVVGEGSIAIGQLGDGDALIRSNGVALRPVPDDARLVAGETTSLCLDSAPDDFRFSSAPAGTDIVLLATDGYGNSFATADWWSTLVDDLAWFLQGQGFPALQLHFADWLEESAVVGGDDVTAVVVARSPLVVPGADPALTER